MIQWMRRQALLLLLCLPLLTANTGVFAEDYRIDTQGAHASINFKIKHLGYSWLTGRFNHFRGKFSYDNKKPESSQIELTVYTASIDSNHAERDKHLRGKKYLDTQQYPSAKFVSTRYKTIDAKTGQLSGNLTLHGVTRPVAMTVTQTGAGKDPWGGFRRGFETAFTIRLHDYGISHDLGAASEELELTIYIEGIRDQKYIGE